MLFLASSSVSAACWSSSWALPLAGGTVVVVGVVVRRVVVAVPGVVVVVVVGQPVSPVGAFEMQLARWVRPSSWLRPSSTV